MDGNSSINSRRIALLAGGNSAERDVSIASGEQTAVALSIAGHEPVLIDPAQIELDAIDWAAFDACFVALHGGAGEDGRVQAELECLAVPYTGSGPEASRLAMRKASAKDRFRRCNVPTLPFVVLSADASTEIGLSDSLKEEIRLLGFPVIVKPEGQGSSLGVQVARGLHDFVRCVLGAAEFDDRALIEPFIAGREFTISLLGSDPLPMIEIISPQAVFSYEAKYADRATQYHFDTNLPPHVEAELYQVAIAAAKALGTSGLARVDLMLDRENRPWVLEVNTIPGLTARSLAPRAARAAGIEFPALVDWMVRDAIHRRRDKAARRTARESQIA